MSAQTVPKKLTPKGTPPQPGKTRKPRPGKNRQVGAHCKQQWDGTAKVWVK